MSEANGVLRNHYYSPSVTIYIEKRLTNQSIDFLVSLLFFLFITVHTAVLLSKANKYKEISIIYNGLIIISYICCI